MSARKVNAEIPVRKKSGKGCSLRRQQKIEGRDLSNDGDMNLILLLEMTSV